MKVILSRKGFDSGYGGIASPILSNAPISLPIPTDIPVEKKLDSDYYAKLKLCNTYTYKDIILDLQYQKKHPDKVLYKRRGKQPMSYTIDEEIGCHLDPDIFDKVIDRQPGWQGLFGQCGSPQGVLNNSGIKVGDLFLFFGWFRRAKSEDGEFHYVSPDLQVIFGYLEIGAIWNYLKEGDIWKNATFETAMFPEWAKYHPHNRLRAEVDYRKNNTIYIASNRSSLDNRKPGWGVFQVDEKDDKLILTADNLTRSRWTPNSIFNYLKAGKFQNNESRPYFQSYRGQEFVFCEPDDCHKVEKWAEDLIQTSKLIPGLT